jgi:acetyltransferase, GNAT family
MIHYTNQQSLTAAQFADVLNRPGLHRPPPHPPAPPRRQPMLDEADILWTAGDGERLVGVARALTDYAYACYLSDLAVDASHQRQGIGKTLVAHLQAQIGADVALILLAAANAMDYYPKIGFEALDNGFIIRRRSF